MLQYGDSDAPITSSPELMNDQQRAAMMDDLIHAVKVAIHHHQEHGNHTAACALFEEWQEWIVDGCCEVHLIDSILPA